MSSPYARRRERFLRALPERACAIIGGAAEMRRNGDVHYPFRQHSDLLYLTGFPEPDALAVFTPGRERRFTLLVRPRDAEQERWTGRRVGVEGAVERYGADQAFPITEAPQRLHELLDGCDEVFLHPGDNPELDALVLRTMAALRRRERQGCRAPRRITDIQTVLHEQRLIKDEEALASLRRAVEITAEAHRLAMGAARAGTYEYEIEALVDYTFRRHGGYPGYGTIVAAGANATILHYVDAADVLRPGQLLLVDGGCEWQGFTADVTRTYPVATAEGRACFSPAQRRVYEVVLRAQQEGIALARPGVTIDDIHRRCIEVLTEGMVALGLLSGQPAELIDKGEYKRYYMHRTSHWLGMDVHDVGDYAPGGQPRPLQPGMVFTIEPGLYIGEGEQEPPEYRGIGVRIEDDILITEDGHEVLTRAIPKDPSELEALVGSGRT
ncbi:MAG: aminopeptidase P N-terminal domain-containing protein [Myxococcales bacterium]|nr:aminopeptidase P N-terminal domain-containing protein [Myxococcota bacterium]MDW8282510.1 aminopeptidase P N-terminal domain-containing protein [Myxococcales bacterium]